MVLPGPQVKRVCEARAGGEGRGGWGGPFAGALPGGSEGVARSEDRTTSGVWLAVASISLT